MSAPMVIKVYELLSILIWSGEEFTYNYGSGGTVNENIDCSGIRLLAVNPEVRNLRVGKALTNACIRRAKDIGTSQVILHSTKSMEVAWKMYEKMGFARAPDLDFSQGKLAV